MMKFFSALCICLMSIQVLAQDSKPPQSFSDGWEALKKSDYKNAAALFRQAISEKPNMVVAHYNLGRALVLQKDYREALDAFGQILSLNPLYPEDLYAHYEIGKIYILLEDYSRGIDEYNWLKTKEPKDSQSTAVPAPPFTITDKPSAVVEGKTDPEVAPLPTALAQYLLDMIPAKIAESNNLPATKIVYTQSADTEMREDNLESPAGAARPVPKEQQGMRGTSVRSSSTEPMTASMRPKLLYQEKAKYTEIARRNWIQGTVMLSVVFDASGHLSGFRVIRGLPDGLTQSAIRAAQKIRFTPANRDGAPVSVRGTLEYSYNLY